MHPNPGNIVYKDNCIFYILEKKTSNKHAIVMYELLVLNPIYKSQYCGSSTRIYFLGDILTEFRVNLPNERCSDFLNEDLIYDQK